jgi:hypothetical protein
MKKRKKYCLTTIDNIAFSIKNNYCLSKLFSRVLNNIDFLSIFNEGKLIIKLREKNYKYDKNIQWLVYNSFIFFDWYKIQILINLL